MKIKITTLTNVFKKCEFDKARLKAMFSKRQTQRKRHVLHTIMLTHQHNYKHIMQTMLYAPMLHRLIMHFYMPRCTHAPIVTEKVTWLSFVMIELILLMIMCGFGRLILYDPRKFEYQSQPLY